MGELSRLELARRQIDAARTYTLSLLHDLQPEDWFRTVHFPASARPDHLDADPQPENGSRTAQGVTHIAWQVGHLAMAEYGLCLFRIRGRRPEDLQLMPGRFRKQFSRGSTPVADPAAYPPPAEIRQVFDRIHQQALDELAGCSDQTLDEKIEEPYAVFDTKLGGLLFCAHHEMLHAGQIGLLRRLIDKPPLR